MGGRRGLRRLGPEQADKPSLETGRRIAARGLSPLRSLGGFVPALPALLLPLQFCRQGFGLLLVKQVGEVVALLGVERLNRLPSFQLRRLGEAAGLLLPFQGLPVPQALQALGGGLLPAVAPFRAGAGVKTGRGRIQGGALAGRLPP